MKTGWAGSRGWGASGHWLSSAPPGGSGSLSGASAWASRTAVSDALARAPAVASPSRCTWGPAPCSGCTANSWGCGAIESFCWGDSSCQTWRNSWKSESRTCGRVNSLRGACWASPGSPRKCRVLFSWSSGGYLFLSGRQAEEPGWPFPGQLIIISTTSSD